MTFFSFCNTYLLGACLPPTLLAAGLYFYMRLGAFPLRHPKRMLRRLFGGGGSRRSSLSALMLALAGTLGVGNITGVAVAISVGGAGAVFWMWVSGIAAAILKYAEITLSLDARCRAGKSRGAIDYITPSLGRHAGLAFAALSLLLSLTMGSLLQGNVISDALSVALPVAPVAVGLFLAGITLLLFLGGRRAVTRLTGLLIPVLTLAYTGVSLALIIVNITSLPSVFSRILHEAFSLRSLGAGVGGFGMARAIRAGISKGLFSNEAGAGTAPFAHGAADTAIPAHQGLFGLVEVFVDTILMCTLTALAILVVHERIPDLSGTGLVTAAFADILGNAAAPFVSLSILFFSYATVACWVGYGQTALGYFSTHPTVGALYALLFSALLVVGALLPADGAFDICDTVLGAMTLINIAALLKNRARIRTLTEEYGLIGNKKKR